MKITMLPKKRKGKKGRQSDQVEREQAAAWGALQCRALAQQVQGWIQHCTGKEKREVCLKNPLISDREKD